MAERERLEREIYQLTAIIKADTDALGKKSTTDSDRVGLLRQIEIRTAKRDHYRSLLRKLNASDRRVAPTFRAQGPTCCNADAGRGSFGAEERASVDSLPPLRRSNTCTASACAWASYV
jgi:hypothetical protein